MKDKTVPSILEQLKHYQRLKSQDSATPRTLQCKGLSLSHPEKKAFFRELMKRWHRHYRDNLTAFNQTRNKRKNA